MRLLCMRRLLTATKEITELLIAKGADVNAKNDWGQDPWLAELRLNSAIMCHQTEVAEPTPHTRRQDGCGVVRLRRTAKEWLLHR